MNAEQRVLIIDSGLKNCKAIKYALTEYGIGAYYTLSVIDGIEHRARAYEMGADDFIQKPLELQECLLRAQALLRRYNVTAPPLPGQRCYTIVTTENLMIDSLTRRVAYNGRELDLTRREFDLLYVLSSQAGRVLTHKQLRYYVWGDDFSGNETNTIPVSVSHLRQKLDGGDCIENIRGVGYRFNGLKRKKE